MDGHSSRVFAVTFHPERETEFISGGWDNTIQVNYHYVSIVSTHSTVSYNTSLLSHCGFLFLVLGHQTATCSQVEDVYFISLVSLTCFLTIMPLLICTDNIVFSFSFSSFCFNLSRSLYGPHVCGDALHIDPSTNQILSGSWRKHTTLEVKPRKIMY